MTSPRVISPRETSPREASTERLIKVLTDYQKGLYENSSEYFNKLFWYALNDLPRPILFDFYRKMLLGLRIKLGEPPTDIEALLHSEGGDLTAVIERLRLAETTNPPRDSDRLVRELERLLREWAGRDNPRRRDESTDDSKQPRRQGRRTSWSWLLPAIVLLLAAATIFLGTEYFRQIITHREKVVAEKNAIADTEKQPAIVSPTETPSQFTPPSEISGQYAIALINGAGDKAIIEADIFRDWSFKKDVGTGFTAPQLKNARYNGFYIQTGAGLTMYKWRESKQKFLVHRHFPQMTWKGITSPYFD